MNFLLYKNLEKINFVVLVFWCLLAKYKGGDPAARSRTATLLRLGRQRQGSFTISFDFSPPRGTQIRRSQ